jgi:hypothetical protein
VTTTIAAERLRNHRLARPGANAIEELVAWFGAVQAQDYGGATWALALRTRGHVTADPIARALNSGRILRTHVLRPTWHFVAANDVGWMLRLSAARVHRRLAYAYRYYGLDPATRVRAAGLFERALSSGHLTRGELGAHLARAGLPAKGVHLALLTVYAELEGVMCSGAARGKEQTYALLAERVKQGLVLEGDEAVAELTRRYLRSHAPATIRDFVWWSGLTVADAKRGLEIIGAKHEAIDGRTHWRLGRVRPRAGSTRAVHLLPIYDEYLVAYRDRDAVPRLEAPRFSLGPAVIVDGQIVGSWKAVASGDEVVLKVTSGRRLSATEHDALEHAAERYGRHLQKSGSLEG